MESFRKLTMQATHLQQEWTTSYKKTPDRYSARSFPRVPNLQHPVILLTKGVSIREPQSEAEAQKGARTLQRLNRAKITVLCEGSRR